MNNSFGKHMHDEHESSVERNWIVWTKQMGGSHILWLNYEYIRILKIEDAHEVFRNPLLIPVYVLSTYRSNNLKHELTKKKWGHNHKHRNRIAIFVHREGHENQWTFGKWNPSSTNAKSIRMCTDLWGTVELVGYIVVDNATTDPIRQTISKITWERQQNDEDHLLNATRHIMKATLIRLNVRGVTWRNGLNQLSVSGRSPK